MRKKLATLTLVALALGPLPAAMADDSDIFVAAYADPSVVILLDSSGSMNDPVGSGGGDDKIDIAKDALIDLVSNVSNIQFGIFKFNAAENGAELVAPAGTSTSDLVNLISDINAAGGTPLGKATGDLEDYFSGNWFGCPESDPTACLGNGDDDDDDDFVSGDDDDDDDDSCSYVTCETPIANVCQKNFAIVTSDGFPTADDYDEQIVDAAASLYTTDFSTLDGDQNVTVHTIGFDNAAGKSLMIKAAAAGGGNFYEANNAAQLRAALIAAVSSISEESFSFASPRIPSTSFDGGDKAYIASFNPHSTRAFWNGELKAYTKTAGGLIPVGGDGKPDETALAWNAGQKLADKTAASRKIYTVIGGARNDFTTANGNVTAAVLGLSTTTDRDKLINFVRGTDAYDEDADGNTTEQRGWKLGDIFHSGPQLVYPPPLYSTDSTYNTFRTTHASRGTVVLVGANDGMLHAFSESDGAELWAFIPPDVLDQLSLSAAKVGDHAFFVDSTPVVADVKLSGTWKTVAIFGMRRGGASYHALDITDTADPKYLWSFTDGDIAESWSEPAITKVRMADGTDRWVAFVGGGYNTANNNADGAAVYAIDIASGAALWKYSNNGTNDTRFMNFSIVATPAVVDTDGDGYANFVYVGDVGGQLWKFNTAPAATLTSGKVNNWTGMRLFAADSGQANPPAAGRYLPAQPMYSSPVVVLDTSGYRWVSIGTGDRNNPLRSSNNKFYAIKDTRGMTNGTTLTEADLTSALTADAVTQGWYYPLAADEKVLARAEVFDGITYFSTFTSESSDACEPAGSARLYAVKLASGHAAIDWSDLSHTSTTDGTEDRSKEVGDGIPSAPQVTMDGSTASLVVSTTDKDISMDSFAAPPRKRLRYWREVD